MVRQKHEDFTNISLDETECDLCRQNAEVLVQCTQCQHLYSEVIQQIVLYGQSDHDMDVQQHGLPHLGMEGHKDCFKRHHDILNRPNIFSVVPEKKVSKVKSVFKSILNPLYKLKEKKARRKCNSSLTSSSSSEDDSDPQTSEVQDDTRTPFQPTNPRHPKISRVEVTREWTKRPISYSSDIAESQYYVGAPWDSRSLMTEYDVVSWTGDPAPASYPAIDTTSKSYPVIDTSSKVDILDTDTHPESSYTPDVTASRDALPRYSTGGGRSPVLSPLPQAFVGCTREGFPRSSSDPLMNRRGESAATSLNRAAATAATETTAAASASAGSATDMWPLQVDSVSGCRKSGLLLPSGSCGSPEQLANTSPVCAGQEKEKQGRNCGDQKPADGQETRNSEREKHAMLQEALPPDMGAPGPTTGGRENPPNSEPPAGLPPHRNQTHGTYASQINDNRSTPVCTCGSDASRTSTGCNQKDGDEKKDNDKSLGCTTCQRLQQRPPCRTDPTCECGICGGNYPRSHLVEEYNRKNKQGHREVTCEDRGGDITLLLSSSTTTTVTTCLAPPSQGPLITDISSSECPQTHDVKDNRTGEQLSKDNDRCSHLGSSQNHRHSPKHQGVKDDSKDAQHSDRNQGDNQTRRRSQPSKEDLINCTREKCKYHNILWKNVNDRSV